MNFEKLAKQKPLKILLAEDNKVNQILTLGLLRSLGYQAEMVADGQLAVEAADHSRFDLILMDCQLPVLDGYTAAQIIKGRLGARIKIAAYTSHVSEKERDRCREVGMEFLLPKPISLGSLTLVISQVYDVLYG